MKNVSAQLLSHLQQETTSLATCWKVTRVDNQIFGFTDLSENIEIDGLTYVASTGYNPSDVASSSTFNVDNMEVVGAISADFITASDIHDGRWDYATVEIFRVNYEDLTQGVLNIRYGWLGEIESGNIHFKSELRGMTQKLQQSIGRIFTPTCDVEFGSTKCGINLALHTQACSVTSESTSQRDIISTDLVLADGLYDYGKITWTSGENVGLTFEIKSSLVGSLVLQLPCPRAIQLGDTFDAVEGCKRRYQEDCINRFNNAINFRGFPFVPGVDQLTKGIDG